MFDKFKPKEGFCCPVCEKELSEWQCHDLDCALFVWEEGKKYPVGTGQDEVNLNEEYFKSTIKANEFFISSFDCGCPFPTKLKCRVEDGVWNSTELFTGTEADLQHVGPETKSKYKERIQWLNKKL